MNEPAFSLNEPTLSPVATLEADRTPSAPAAEPDSFDYPDSVQCFGSSDIGRVREGNQDSFLVTRLVQRDAIPEGGGSQVRRRVLDPDGHLLVVADGMGGHLGGERASALTVETVEATLRELIPRDGQIDERGILDALREAITRADHKVWEEGQSNAELRGMGTTLTIAFSFGSELYLGHVGDSRCYMLRDGKLAQLTQDHTVFGDLVRRGALRPDTAAGHYFRHILTAAVGTGNATTRAELRKLPLRRGDVLLLCSDGLSEMVFDDELTVVLKENEEPTSASRALVDLANHHGGRDNVTALVARYP